MVKWFEKAPVWLKVVFALPLLDIIWGIFRIVKGATKGNCVEFLRNHLKNIKLVAAIGDFENDLSLLEKSDVSFAPQNAFEDLKQKANYIVSHHNSNAIKDVVEILESKNSEF